MLQKSAETSNDFTNPVKYTVIAADKSTKEYTVTVTADKGTDANITAFSLGGTTGDIRQNEGIINVLLPAKSDIAGYY